MLVIMKIPYWFENDFTKDRFEESLKRLCTDAHLLAGRYDREVGEMLIQAFKESKVIYYN